MLLKILTLLALASISSQSPPVKPISNDLKGVDPNTLECDPEGQKALLLPHYEDCDKFYMCTHGEEVLFSCPEGTIFDFERQTCNFPRDTKCILRETESESSSSEEDEDEGSGGEDVEWGGGEGSESSEVTNEPDEPKPTTKPPKPDNKPPKPDGRPPKPDGRPPKPDGRPPKPDGRPPKPDGRPPKPDGRPPKPDGRPPKPDHDHRPPPRHHHGPDHDHRPPHHHHRPDHHHNHHNDHDHHNHNHHDHRNDENNQNNDRNNQSQDKKRDDRNDRNGNDKLTEINFDRKNLNCGNIDDASQQVPHRSDCQRYWKCVHGHPQQFFCSDGLFFNRKTQQCDFEANAKCEKNEYDELKAEYIVT